MFDAYHDIASERYEHQLKQELGAMRLEMHQGFSGVREEMAGIRVDILKWSLLFWLGQFAAVVGALSFMLRR